MLKEFKAFILRGNVVDIAVGIIIGGAFGKISASLVGDILMPPLGLLLSRVDFRELAIRIADGKDGKPVLISYGNFVSTIVDFVIVAFAIFLVVKGMNTLQNLRKKEEAPPPPPATRPCTFCLMDVPVKATKCGHCTSAIPS
jgi:large conductance mechanosensitive channel